MANDTKPIPKYFRIMQRIVADIRNGKLAAGAKVPSENELIDAHKISNTTARKVLLELERAGWADRVKGKGTYVRGKRVDRSVDRILSFTRNMTEAGRVPSTRLLSVRPGRRGKALAINGRRYTMRGPVCEITRLRLADDVPMMFETRYVSQQLCPGIEKKDLEGSLYDIYELDYGLHLEQVDQSVSAVIIDAEKTGFADVEGRIPALRVEGVTTCGKELILEMEKSIYRGDAYRFSVRATRSPRGLAESDDHALQEVPG